MIVFQYYCVEDEVYDSSSFKLTVIANTYNKKSCFYKIEISRVKARLHPNQNSTKLNKIK